MDRAIQAVAVDVVDVVAVVDEGIVASHPHKAVEQDCALTEVGTRVTTVRHNEAVAVSSASPQGVDCQASVPVEHLGLGEQGVFQAESPLPDPR